MVFGILVIAASILSGSHGHSHGPKQPTGAEASGAGHGHAHGPGGVDHAEEAMSNIAKVQNDLDPPSYDDIFADFEDEEDEEDEGHGHSHEDHGHTERKCGHTEI